MGRVSPRSSHIARYEECDDNGSVISGLEPVYAKSEAPGSPRKKQQPNTGKSRRESRRENAYASDDSSDSTAHPTAGKKKSKSRPKEDRRSSGPVVVKDKRPAPRSSKTAPMPYRGERGMPDEAYHTVPPPGARPRAQTRPMSYYGQSPARQSIPGPYFQPPSHHGPHGPSYQPPPPHSFGPPSFSGSYGAPPPMGPHGHMPPPPPFHPDLTQRFGPGRPASAMGYRQPSNPDLYYENVSDKPSRKASVSRKAGKDSREKEDRKRMPPPPRPKSTRPALERVVLRPQIPPQGPPQGVSRKKSVGFDEGDYSDDEIHYAPPRRESGVEYGSSPFKNRRQSFHEPNMMFDYEDDDYEEPVPQPKQRSRSRRDSRMHLGLEDKINSAARYQDGVMAPGSALTAEALRYKNGGSQPSTRSTESRDESEYKHSATTHTTRSSSGEDDITIKVPMGAVVEVGGTRIHCKDGGDISVPRNNASIKGSDRGTVYGDDRRSRSDRSGNRLRASSHAAFARGLPAPERQKYSSSPLYSDTYYDDEDYAYHHDRRYERY